MSVQLFEGGQGVLYTEELSEATDAEDLAQRLRQMATDCDTLATNGGRLVEFGRDGVGLFKGVKAMERKPNEVTLERKTEKEVSMSNSKDLEDYFTRSKVANKVVGKHATLTDFQVLTHRGPLKGTVTPRKDSSKDAEIEALFRRQGMSRLHPKLA